MIELNIHAVVLAQGARDRAADRPVYIACSVSNFGAWTETQYQRFMRSARLSVSEDLRTRSLITEVQARCNLAEQVTILVNASVGFLIAEATGDEIQRGWVLEGGHRRRRALLGRFQVPPERGRRSASLGLHV